jgi:hypothetical protein
MSSASGGGNGACALQQRLIVLALAQQPETKSRSKNGPLASTRAVGTFARTAIWIYLLAVLHRRRCFARRGARSCISRAGVRVAAAALLAQDCRRRSRRGRTRLIILLQPRPPEQNASSTRQAVAAVAAKGVRQRLWQRLRSGFLAAERPAAPAGQCTVE